MHQYSVTQVDLAVSVVVEADWPPKLVNIRITHPNTCSLKYDELAHAVCGFVTASLNLAQTTVQPSKDGLLPIGMARGDKRSQMLCLRVQGHLAMVADASATSGGCHQL